MNDPLGLLTEEPPKEVQPPKDPLGLLETPPAPAAKPGVVEQAGNLVKEGAKGVGRFVSDPRKLGRLVFEMGGAAAGGALGSGAAPVAGTLAGTALGYAFGDKLADIVYGERLPPEKARKAGPQLWQSTKDVGTGLVYGGIGKAMDLAGRGLYAGEEAVRGIRGSGLMPWMTGKVEDIAEKQAAKRIAGAATKAPVGSPLETQIGKNIEGAEKLETEIPGLQFNVGQRTGDPNLLSLARQQSQKAGAGTGESGKSVMEQNEAMGNYIKQHIRGGGKVDDFLASIQGEQNRLAGETATTGAAAESEATKLGGMGEQEAGAGLLEKAAQGRKTGARRAKELYENVPEDLKINATPLWDKVDNLFGNFDALTQRLGATPTGPMGRIREAMKPELVDATGKRMAPTRDMPAELTMRQIKDFRSQISAAQRGALVNRDYELAYNLGQLKEGINDSLGEAAETGQGEAVNALKEATKYWRESYIPKFRQGPTGKILAPTRTGEPAVPESAIGGQYFKSGKGAAEAADNFNYVFAGDPEAKEFIRDYASQSLLKYARNPATGELESKRIASWLYQHATALEKHGLKREFGSLQKAMKVADEARGAEMAFNKTALARTLNEDPEKAISTALMTGTGRKQSIQRLQEMVKLARVDKTGSAMAGLKAGIGDYFQKLSTVARDIRGNPLASFAKMDRFMEGFRPALKQSGLYSPYELKAFDNVHKAIQTIAQQQRPTAGFAGSPTVEILSRVAASGTSVAVGRMGIYGASLGIFQKILKGVIGERVDEALAKAVFDPRYAAAISGLAYNAKKLPAERASKIFTQQMATLGLMAKERPKAINREVRPEAASYESGQPIRAPGAAPIDHSKYETE